MLATINSVKHYIQPTLTEIGSGTVREIVAAVAVTKNTARTNTTQVEEGSVIKAVYFEMWLNGQTAAGVPVQFTMIICKLPSGKAPPTLANMANLQSWDNKAEILYSTQGALDGAGSQSVPIHRSWVLIPKGKQRMSLGDEIIMSVAAVSGAIDSCGLMTYKEFY